MFSNQYVYDEDDDEKPHKEGADSDDESKLRAELEKYGDDPLDDEDELADADFSMDGEDDLEGEMEAEDY